MYKRLLFVLTILFISGLLFTGEIYSGPRNIVMEFSTGTWCGFCPCGEQVADSILTAYPNTIIIGYHSGGSDPFVNAEATAVFNLIGYSASPTLCLDRTNHPGDASHPYVSYSQWSNKYYQRYTTSPTTVIDVVVTSKDYNPSTRVLNVTVSATALQNLTGQYKVHFIMTESNIVYPQNFYTCGYVGYDSNYIHKWFPRTIINGSTGENLNTGGVWNQNQVITKSFTKTVSGAWVADNCKYIALVFKDSSTGIFVSEIQQAVQKGVTSPLGVEEENKIPSDYSLSQNYPNPFNPVTHIHFSIPKSGNVSLRIYDISGKEIAVFHNGFMQAGIYNAEVDGSKWASGVYFYKLESEGFSAVKKMLLVK